MNTFLLDGAYDTDRNTFAIAVYPPMESVQEFHIQSTLAPAEFPQSGGGAIDVVTKSGTRKFHGSGFDYLRNEATDARNYFDDPALARPIFRQNEFGAALGGPMPLLEEHVFLRDLRRHAPQAAATRGSRIVPDQTTRGGDFSGQSTIYDPLSGPAHAVSRATGFRRRASTRSPTAYLAQIRAAAQHHRRDQQLSGCHAQSGRHRQRLRPPRPSVRQSRAR